MQKSAISVIHIFKHVWQMCSVCEMNAPGRVVQDKSVVGRVCGSTWQVQGTARQTNILVAFIRYLCDIYAPHVTLYTEALSGLDLVWRWMNRLLCL